MDRFSHKHALVTGAASGIGRAMVLALAGEGAFVHMVDCNEEGLQSLEQQFPKNLTACPCDLSDLNQWKATLRSISSLDVLIHSAAISLPTSLSLRDDPHWNRIWAINFEAVLESCRHAVEVMSDGGKIVHISSIQTRLYERGGLAYAVAKAGLEQLTRGLAVELAPRRILVNAVAPGYVDTAMSRASGVNELETDWFQERFIQQARIPLQRAAQPEEIARIVLFLASSENTYVTGQILCADGGLTLTL